jgi:hypothetical protein
MSSNETELQAWARRAVAQLLRNVLRKIARGRWL